MEIEKAPSEFFQSIQETTNVVTDEVTEHTVMLKDNFCYKYLWAFILVVVVVILICFSMSYSELNWYQELNNYSWSGNMVVMGIILVIILLIMAYCTFIGYSYATEANKTNILFLFVASLLVLILWFYVFYNAKNLENAFYIGIFFLFLTFVQTYFVWKSNIKAGYGMLLYILWAVVAVVITWNISNTNTVE